MANDGYRGQGSGRADGDGRRRPTEDNRGDSPRGNADHRTGQGSSGRPAHGASGRPAQASSDRFNPTGASAGYRGAGGAAGRGRPSSGTSGRPAVAGRRSDSRDERSDERGTRSGGYQGARPRSSSGYQGGGTSAVRTGASGDRDRSGSRPRYDSRDGGGRDRDPRSDDRPRYQSGLGAPTRDRDGAPRTGPGGSSETPRSSYPRSGAARSLSTGGERISDRPRHDRSASSDRRGPAPAGDSPRYGAGSRGRPPAGRSDDRPSGGSAASPDSGRRSYQDRNDRRAAPAPRPARDAARPARDAGAYRSGAVEAGGYRGDRPERGGYSSNRESRPGSQGRSAGSRPLGGGQIDRFRSGSRSSDRTSAARERIVMPAVPAGVDPSMLDAAVRADLRSLAPETSESVALQLVAAGLLVDDEPVKALVHARAARSIAARVGAVREAVGVAAYHAQEWTEALAELRAARRISGDPRWLAVMADCERALGRPERALKALDDPDLRRLDAATQVEVLIVVAGARRDMGQLDAALQLLERGGLNQDKPQPGSARLWYTYADTLSQLGREDEAREWFGVVAAMPDDETDAAERAGIDQVDFEYAEGFEELDHDADEQSSSDA
jgi:hypothetical protein